MEFGTESEILWLLISNMIKYVAVVGVFVFPIILLARLFNRY